MIKEEKKISESIIRRVFCDFCNEEFSHRYTPYRCTMCERDLCNKCTAYIEDFGNDYNPIYCKSCWSIGDTYRKLIEYCEKEVSKLTKQWRDGCIENAKEETNGKV